MTMLQSSRISSRSARRGWMPILKLMPWGCKAHAQSTHLQACQSFNRIAKSQMSMSPLVSRRRQRRQPPRQRQHQHAFEVTTPKLPKRLTWSKVLIMRLKQQMLLTVRVDFLASCSYAISGLFEFMWVCRHYSHFGVRLSHMPTSSHMLLSLAQSLCLQLFCGVHQDCLLPPANVMEADTQ